MGIDCSRRISTWGTVAAASTEESRRQLAAMISRKITPVPISAARAPLKPTRIGTMIEPKARPTFMSDSSIEKTSASTCGGAERCRRMRPVTSRTVRPKPASASRAKAVRTVGKMPSRPRASAAVSTPAPSAGARRRRATRPAVSAAPMSPPAPKAEFR